MVLITNEEKKIPHHNKTNSNYYLDKVPRCGVKIQLKKKVLFTNYKLFKGYIQLRIAKKTTSLKYEH